MSGLYIHIPFCKQKCHYCDFHFSVSQRQLPDMVGAIQSELELRKDEWDQPLETIYFGGGTPSLLSKSQLSGIFETIHKSYKVIPNPEITLEANPDDLSDSFLKDLTELPINRLSIGVQSFHQKDLEWMHRAHDSKEALNAIKLAQDIGFKNLTIDLIYGLPESTPEEWQKNLEIFFSLDIPHLSAYALTVEPYTALSHLIKKGTVQQPKDDKALADYKFLIHTMKDHGYEHYEISNFALPEHYAVHNTAYWQGKSYLGIGPSAHSYHGNIRSWNIANNSKYIKAIASGQLPSEKEILTTNDRFNEYLMTGLRTQWGINTEEIQDRFGAKYYKHFLEQLASHKLAKYFIWENEKQVKIMEEGLFFADSIIADLFYID